MSPYHVRISLDYHPHDLDLTSDRDVEAAVTDLSGGRDASVFGGTGLYRFEFPAKKRSLLGPAEMLQDLADAAILIRSSGLAAEMQSVLWDAIVRDGPTEGLTYAEYADELVSEQFEANPSRALDAHKAVLLDY